MIRPLPLLALLALLAAPAAAQVGLASSARTVVLTATKPGSVGITLPGGSAATLPTALTLGANDFAPLPIETSWDLDPSRTSAVSLVAFFQAPGAALVAGGATIPASALLGRVTTGSPTAYTRFTGAAVTSGEVQAGVAGGTLVLFSQPISPGSAAGRRTDQLQMRIDLTGWPDLPAGTYQGTLNLLAVTQ
jgi:hypothetical protein